MNRFENFSKEEKMILEMTIGGAGYPCENSKYKNKLNLLIKELVQNIPEKDRLTLDVLENSINEQRSAS